MSDVTSEAKEDKTIQTESIGTSGERSPDHAGLAQMSTMVEYPLYDTKGGGFPRALSGILVIHQSISEKCRHRAIKTWQEKKQKKCPGK